MEKITVNLDGIPTEITRTKIPLKQLILDIENPRIQYFVTPDQELTHPPPEC